MKLDQQLSHVLPKIAAIVRGLSLWILDFIAWIAEYLPLPRDVRLFVQHETRDVRKMLRMMLTIAIAARMTFPDREPTFPRPQGPARGFRYQRRRLNPTHLFTRGIRLRTLADIRRALDNFDAIAERAAARAPKGVAYGAIMMTCAPALVFDACAPAPAAEAADTS